MKLYFTPGACSLAAHIALREAAIPFELVKTDIRSKKLPDGSDYLAVNPKGYVPALRLDSGELLTENVALLQYIADLNPSARLAPPAGTIDRYRLVEWLAFINSEVHKSFSPLFAPVANEVKEYTRGKINQRLGWLNEALGTKKFLMGDQFTVADAYLFVLLNWGGHTNIDIGQWPNLKRLQDSIAARPRVGEALKAEGLAH
jgi:glutathione S-transferase